MMRKLLIALLALTFLVSMTGMSFASDNSWFSKWKSGSSIKSDIKKNIKFENKADAKSGNANAVANDAVTRVNSDSKATTDDNDSLANNDSQKTVTNTGNALAYSEKADALNDVVNDEEESITEKASSKSDVSVTVDADFESCCGIGVPLQPSSVNNSDGSSSCCPATIDGDICINVKYDNVAKARTGNATASGNLATTEICSEDKAFANDGGSADNNSDIRVTNDGEAIAYSETAVATNEAQNKVKINILRDAESYKKVDVFAELTASIFPFDAQ